MPNHYTTVGLFAYRPEEDSKDLNSLVGKNLCEIVKPMPKELYGICAATEPYIYRNTKTGERWVKDCNGPTGNERENWKQEYLNEFEIEYLKNNYGAAVWYNWCINNWGTKWGIYDLVIHNLSGDGSPKIIEFQSAWGPPLPEIFSMIEEYLKKEYGLINPKWIGHDPYDGSTRILHPKDTFRN